MRCHALPRRMPISEMFSIHHTHRPRGRAGRMREADSPRACTKCFERFSQVFRAFDVDRDGFLDRHEIRSGLADLGLPVSLAHVEHIVASCDKNNDGRISVTEFQSFADARARELRKAYDQIRKESGEIGVNELRGAVKELGLIVSDASIQRLLQRADADSNGSISFEEFNSFLFFAPGDLPSDLFDYWAHSSAIDIGESVPVVDHYLSYRSAMVTLTSGAIAGAVSRTATAPMDRLKVILQAGSGTQATMLQGIRSIYAEGGWRAFWRGNGANVLKIAPETAVKFLCYDALKAKLCASPNNPTPLERFGIGAMAGAIAQAAVYPLEIAKTRLAVSPPGTYAGIADCLKQITTQGGVPALYRGIGPSLVGIMPYAGVDLAVYTWLKDKWLREHNGDEGGPNVATLLSYGAVSSTAGQLVAYPMQLVRTKMQAQGMPGVPNYNGALDCLRDVLQRDGVRGLYRGLGPNFVKTLPAITISYAVFETSKGALS